MKILERIPLTEKKRLFFPCKKRRRPLRESMRIGLLALLLLPGFSPLLSAPTAQIERIRTLYQEQSRAIAKTIELARAGEPGELYANDLIFNTYDGSWRAVGTYRKSVTFWYADDPTISEEGASVLRRVTVTTVSAARSYYEEFVFDGGEPVFYFRRTDSERPFELRCYWHQKKPIRLIEDGKTNDRPSGSKVTAQYDEAMRYRELFLKSMEL